MQAAGVHILSRSVALLGLRTVPYTAYGRILTAVNSLLYGMKITMTRTVNQKPRQSMVRYGRHPYVLPPTQGYYDTQYMERPAPDCRGRR